MHTHEDGATLMCIAIANLHKLTKLLLQTSKLLKNFAICWLKIRGIIYIIGITDSVDVVDMIDVINIMGTGPYLYTITIGARHRINTG